MHSGRLHPKARVSGTRPSCLELSGCCTTHSSLGWTWGGQPNERMRSASLFGPEVQGFCCNHESAHALRSADRFWITGLLLEMQKMRAPMPFGRVERQRQSHVQRLRALALGDEEMHVHAGWQSERCELRHLHGRLSLEQAIHTPASSRRLDDSALFARAQSRRSAR